MRSDSFRVTVSLESGVDSNRTRKAVQFASQLKTRDQCKLVPLPVGCNKGYNIGLCDVMLVQNACEQRHKGSNTKDITPREACERVWPKKWFSTKHESMFQYCMAAGEDPALIKEAEKMANLLDSDPKLCRVTKSAHLKKTWLNPSMAADSILAARELEDLSWDRRLMHWDDFQKVHAWCKSHVEKPAQVTAYHGFCANPTMTRQDCYFLNGLSNAWDRDMSKRYCEYEAAKVGNAHASTAKFRCLGLRKSLQRKAKD
jgi:hypothetical protein